MALLIIFMTVLFILMLFLVLYFMRIKIEVTVHFSASEYTLLILGKTFFGLVRFKKEYPTNKKDKVKVDFKESEKNVDQEGFSFKDVKDKLGRGKKNI